MLLLQMYLQRYPVVVWLDSDVLVIDMDRKVEMWVEEMGSASMLVSADWYVGTS